jgi:hypothetical protein
MSRSGILHTVFGFRTNSVTSLLILIYFVVFVGVIVSDSVQHAPKDSGDLNLEQAYRDLHTVSNTTCLRDSQVLTLGINR